MTLPALLTGIPLAAAILVFCLRGDGVRGVIVKLAAALTMALSIATAVTFFGHPAFIKSSGTLLSTIVLAVDVLAAVAILYYTLVKFKKIWIAVLELVQLGLIMWFEQGPGHSVTVRSDLAIDNFAVIMILIAGIIGSLIAVFSLGYMKEFQKEHPEVDDRRPFFFFVIFLFLSAMFGLVISNNLLIMYTCWEITSFCSFLLIGYTQTEEAIGNSFKALWMNLLGGLAFALAIVWLGTEYATVELSMLLNLGRSAQPVELAVALLVFCGFTKAAMMPFSGWLLGAMVAPTPTSALLHSSTMVKAGVFLIIKLCPILGNNHAGLMTMFIGGATFLFASFAAISQSDGKKVLAYSTISNLGLIVCCAGIGSYEAAWTAIMIVVFHAVAKSLMFLSVGTAEQQLGSRNIERFDGIFCSMPGLSLCMIIGICGMFLAPFGMLISKWAAMKAFVDAGHSLLLLVLVFGSSTTLFYWTKWLGKITAYIPTDKNREEGIHGVQWLALRSLSALTIITCILFPLISQSAVIPYLEVTYQTTMDVIDRSNLLIMSMMVILLVVLPLRFGKGRKKKLVVTNLAGENCGDNISYRGVAGQTVPVSLRNWYMEAWFGEARMKLFGFILCGSCLLIEFAIICGGVFHV